MASNTEADASELLQSVERLANQGYSKNDIAQELGFKTVHTFNNRLVKASQQTGKSIPGFTTRRRTQRSRVEQVEVKQRGRGPAFGVNIPQEPLERLGVGPGDRLQVKVRGRKVMLTPESDGDGAPSSGTKQPRVIKKR